jgi:hypothetical protein
VEKTSWYKQKKKTEEKTSSFVGLNANGLPDKPLTRKRKRTISESNQTSKDQNQEQGQDCDNNKNCDTGTSASKEVSGKGACKTPAGKVKNGMIEKKKKVQSQKPETKTVIFIPQTKNSKLAKMLRQEEATLEKMTGYRVKYVEKAGQSIGGLLCKSNHWAGKLCGRGGCLLCYTKEKTGENLGQSCTRRNLVYETWCQTCLERDEEKIIAKGGDPKKTKINKYIGETAKSSYERGFEHQYDRKNLSTTSHMLKHIIDKHEEENHSQIEFRMKVLQYHKSAFERQISESIKIKNNKKHKILNSKGEYNRCALPRLGLKIGTKEFNVAKEKEENEKEKNIEEKIRLLRKNAGKENNRRGKGENSAPKRRKMDHQNHYEESRRTTVQEVTENLGSKRKYDGSAPTNEREENNETLLPAFKKQRKFQLDIRLFVKKDRKDTECGTAEPMSSLAECGNDVENPEHEHDDKRKTECGTTGPNTETEWDKITKSGTAEPSTEGSGTKCDTAKVTGTERGTKSDEENLPNCSIAERGTGEEILDHGKISRQRNKCGTSKLSPEDCEAKSGTAEVTGTECGEERECCENKKQERNSKCGTARPSTEDCEAKGGTAKVTGAECGDERKCCGQEKHEKKSECGTITEHECRQESSLDECGNQAEPASVPECGKENDCKTYNGCAKGYCNDRGNKNKLNLNLNSTKKIKSKGCPERNVES